MARVEKGDASTYPQGIPTQQSCILNIFLLLVYHRDIQYTNTISKSVKIIIFCSQKYNLCTPVHIMSSNIKTLFSFFHRYQTHVDYELFEIFECELVEIFCILYRLYIRGHIQSQIRWDFVRANLNLDTAMSFSTQMVVSFPPCLTLKFQFWSWIISAVKFPLFSFIWLFLSRIRLCLIQ